MDRPNLESRFSQDVDPVKASYLAGDGIWASEFIHAMRQTHMRTWLVRMIKAYQWETESEAIMAADLVDELNDIEPMATTGRCVISKMDTDHRMPSYWEIL